MKQNALSILLVLFLAHSNYSQDTIPNGSFDHWTGFNTPAHWATTNQYLPPGIFTIKKVDSEIDTGFAMQLQTLMLDATLIPGVATLGDLDIGSTSGGVPFTGRPEMLTGYVKHPSDGDEVAMFIEFFKAGELIGYAVWSTTDSIGNYTEINIPVTFMSAQNPDTLNITLLSDPWSPGSTLTIDQLQFIFPLTATQFAGDKSLAIYPNPCTDFINFSGLSGKTATIGIADMNGRIISTHETSGITSIHQVDVGNLPAGLYLISVYAEGHLTRKKIIKQ